MRLVKVENDLSDDVILNLDNVTQMFLVHLNKDSYKWFFKTNNPQDIPCFSDEFESKEKAEKWLKDILWQVDHKKAHESIQIEED